MDWVEKSKKIEDLNVEIFFQLQDNFYIGDPNNYEQLQDEKYSESVTLPAFNRVVEKMARTSEAINNLDDLTLYYRNIIERAYALDMSFNEIRQYFWLRFWFWNTEENVRIPFPWYDSLSEIQNFFSWLKQGQDAGAYVDIDQGWQIEVVHRGDYLHIRQTDPDYEEEYANISVSFETFLKVATEVEERAIEIISGLSNRIGADVWSTYQQDAKFGTLEWQPNKKINRTKKTNSLFSWLFNR